MAGPLGKLPSPLELADTVLDSVAEVVQLPARVAANVTGAIQHGAEGIKQGIEKPKAQAQIPATPDVVIQGGLDAAAGAAQGIVEAAGGVFKAVQDTGEGVRRQLEGLRR